MTSTIISARWQKVIFLLLASLALCFISPRPTVAQPDTANSNTLDKLRQTVIPARDPVDLGKRLLHITTLPATPNQPKNYQIGDTETFTAQDNDHNKLLMINEKLLYKTPHVYMWFQSDYTPDMDAVKRSADNFENNTYPTVHKYFGSEASPGIDNDVHLYLVHARGLGAGIAGYYDSSSGYPKVIVPTSNEHQMFFLNLDLVADQIGTEGYDALLAHEFQHMVHDNVDPNEEGWLNEGMSVTSELLNGYPDLGYVNSFMGSPGTQLNAWAIQDQDATPHYGAAFTFVTYFLQRFGEDALRKLVANPDNGLQSFRSTLKQVNATDSVTHKPVTVEDLFADWTLANLLNDPKIGDGRYAYSLLNGTFQTYIPRTPITVSDEPQTLNANQWGTVYLDVSVPGNYRFSFKGQPTVKIVPTSAHGGKMMWWSNRADLSDTRLTHVFDLSGMKKATLSFWLWHAIEKDWDYGYVMVSTDGGKTWTSLATQDSQSAGGHNNPYGPAYTGESGGDNSPENAIWEHENVDLTPYVGKQIMLRFEYITDDATTEQGMLLDDISIPEINYSTDAETDDGGWIPEGWVRMDNSLPARYVVQMVQYGQATQISRLLGPADGTSGQWSIKVGGDVTEVVISVSGLTDFTTESAPFSYTLTNDSGTAGLGR